jgi:hypothetical protein
LVGLLIEVGTGYLGDRDQEVAQDQSTNKPGNMAVILGRRIMVQGHFWAKTTRPYLKNK